MFALIIVFLMAVCVSASLRGRRDVSIKESNANIQEIYHEIEKLDKLREKIQTDKDIIKSYKHIHMRQNSEIEISPATIQKYKREIKEYQSKPETTILIHSNSSEIEQICRYIAGVTNNGYLATNPPMQIKLSKNYIENLYKIYVYRVQLETVLNEMIRYALPEINANGEMKYVDYDEIIQLLDNRIESLYEKYAINL